MAEKMADLLRCLHFTSIILPRGRNNFKFNNGGRLLSSGLLFISIGGAGGGGVDRI